MSRSASVARPADPLQRRQRQLITPEGVALSVTVASRGARIGALLLDFVIMTLASLLVMLVLFWTLGGLMEQLFGGNNDDVSGAAELVVVVLVIFAFLARYGYFLAFELGPRGATPGKRLIGIRVASRDGGRLTAEAVIARNLLRDIELFLPLAFIQVAPTGEAGSAGIAGLIWFMIFMAFPFFNRDAMRAGDVIAGTWVVEAPRARLAATLSTQGGAKGASELTGVSYRFGEAELSVYGEQELQTLERVLREDRPDAIAAVHAAICRKIGWEPGEGDERAFLEAFYAQLRARLEANMRFGKRKKDKFA
ncbi:MAG: RDD family protein [Erythrobacter sp.]